MRQTKASGCIVRSSSSATMRALRLAVVPLGISLVMTAGAARAGDDQPDDRTITEKIVDSFKSAIRGTNMDNRGIDYRERSPLVVPPKLDLPPPAASTDGVKVANWPKDPDERQRKAAIAAKKKNAPPVARVQAPSEATAAAPAAAGAAPGAVVATAHPVNIAPPPEDPPIPGTTRPAYANDANGTARIDPVYDQPGDLFKGGASAIVPSSISDSFNISNWFGGKKADTAAAAPGSEPTREALTQPPSGYQTPSPNYPYAPESKGLLSGESNPDHNPAAQQSSASSVVR
ncbi:hypothetical protein [Bradyrhizobium sp.]|uniref:hypothetical protein n=1 Tax=Bradyrhizobium sp. TaxID=376 RepID=UPI003C765735